MRSIAWLTVEDVQSLSSTKFKLIRKTKVEFYANFHHKFLRCKVGKFLAMRWSKLRLDQLHLKLPSWYFRSSLEELPMKWCWQWPNLGRKRICCAVTQSNRNFFNWPSNLIYRRGVRIIDLPHQPTTTFQIPQSRSQRTACASMVSSVNATIYNLLRAGKNLKS